MKRVERYVLKELIPVFALGNFLILLMLLLDKIVSLADLFFGRNVPGTLILQTFIYYLPSFLAIGIPAAALLATIIGFSRLSGDSEIIAMKAAGAGGWHLLRPTFAFGIICLLLSFSVTGWLMPEGNARALANLQRMVRSISLADLQPKQQYTELPGLMIYAETKESDSTFGNVILVQRKLETSITAEKGVFRADSDTATVAIELENGRLISAVQDAVNFRAVNFERFIFRVNIPAVADFTALDQRSYPLSRLFAEANDPLIRFELHKRFSLPVSAFIMPLFGLALGIQFARSGRSMGAFMSFFFVFAYNVMFFFAENLAIAGSIDPVLGAWLPNIVFAMIALTLLPRVFR